MEPDADWHFDLEAAKLREWQEASRRKLLQLFYVGGSEDVAADALAFRQALQGCE